LIPKPQKHPYQNPWSWWSQIILLFWRITWLLSCSWTPKVFNLWRLFILRIFGAKISGTPFVHSSVNIQIPWHLSLKHRACLGEKVNAYSLGLIEVQEGATIAQEVYLCTGSHDFSAPSMQLVTKKITILKNAFIGVRAMILPGVTIGENAIIGAQAVVTKSICSNQIFAGNPAKCIGERKNSYVNSSR
jgi:putative colanic acid biosynthesis acetyltransferase WcaF